MDIVRKINEIIINNNKKNKNDNYHREILSIRQTVLDQNRVYLEYTEKKK